MLFNLTPSDIVFRLASTFIAAALIGLDRGERGHTAGLRTTILVGLAACLAMIQANLLLNLHGRPNDSFISMDLMRLPLGILSGVGFLGGGAILRKDDRVRGLTTAACLWFITVVGLCFGGGQLALGWAAAALGLFTLIGLRMVEEKIPQEVTGYLALTLTANGPTEEFLRQQLANAKMKIKETKILFGADASHGRKVSWQLHWLCRDPSHREVPEFVSVLTRTPGVECVEWSG